MQLKVSPADGPAFRAPESLSGLTTSVTCGRDYGGCVLPRKTLADEFATDESHSTNQGESERIASWRTNGGDFAEAS